LEIEATTLKTVDVKPLSLMHINQLSSEKVNDFWVKAMLNHQGISKYVNERDIKGLAFLMDIRCELHKEGFGFDLIFTFS
jgi:Nucleosome assembly protein (NAP)